MLKPRETEGDVCAGNLGELKEAEAAEVVVGRVVICSGGIEVVKLGSVDSREFKSGDILETR